MDEKDFKKALKEQEDMREKGFAVPQESKGTVVQLNINMEEIMKKFEQMMDEDRSSFDEKTEFYFQRPGKKKKKFWKYFEDEQE